MAELKVRRINECQLWISDQNGEKILLATLPTEQEACSLRARIENLIEKYADEPLSS